ncbi:MAG: hypothetical protein D6796_11195, partial [Caldilineae bacterium]
MEADLDTLKQRLADVEREMNALASKQAMSKQANPALQKELDALRYEAEDLRAQIERLSVPDVPPIPDGFPEADSPRQVSGIPTAQMPPIPEATESGPSLADVDIEESPGLESGSSVAPEQVAAGKGVA